MTKMLDIHRLALKTVPLVVSFAGVVVCGFAQLAMATDPPAGDGATSGPAANTLSEAEKAAGWKLLFDGKTTDGWRDYKKQEVSAGWKAADSELVCADPSKAGDIITNDKFDWFELLLDYKMAPGSNSGVMYRVTEDGATAWTTGPEIQLFDNQGGGREVQHAGWLYQLYKPQDDPATSKPVDATRPAGQWNQLRILLSPQKCETHVNGVKYYEYVLGSDDWNERVAKSKFASMKGFGKADSGHIGLQGDHGQVSFRNIKIRPIAGDKKAALEKIARVQVETLDRATVMYFADVGTFPPNFDAFRIAPAGAAQWAGPYTDRDVPLDPWNRPYKYRSPGTRNVEKTDIWSLGPDGQDGTGDDIGNWRPK